MYIIKKKNITCTCTHVRHSDKCDGSRIPYCTQCIQCTASKLPYMRMHLCVELPYRVLYYALVLDVNNNEI